jgi:hypothetical protein
VSLKKVVEKHHKYLLGNAERKISYEKKQTG